MQKKIIQLFFVCILASVYSFPQEGGYVSDFSITQGDSVKFHISTDVNPFDIGIFRIEDVPKYFTAFIGVEGSIQALDDSAYKYGCNWPVVLSAATNENWTPGIYRAEFPISGDSYRGTLFCVKPEVLGSYSEVLLLLSTNTWEAYNNYGGKSFYEFNSFDLERSHQISFQRPSLEPTPGGYFSGDFYRWEIKFIQWAYLNNIKLEFASKYDLDKEPDFLSNYKVVFIVGHNEYWSYEEREQIEQFIDEGGKVIILGGNTSWWQVRFEDNGKSLVCYKNRDLDPLYGVVDSLVTVNWWDTPVNHPENIFTGVSFRNGGFVNTLNAGEIVLPDSLGFGDYAAYNTHHWIYNGTGVKEGDEFGQENTIVGYETDGTLFNWETGIPVIAGGDSTPSSFRILGISPAVNYNPAVTGTHGTMGIYYSKNGGAVFNAATTDWVDGLYYYPEEGYSKDPVVDRITLNVYNKFSEGRIPPEIVSWELSNITTRSINDELAYESNRDFLVKYGSSIDLEVHAVNYSGTPVNYFWSVNGEHVSDDSLYQFRNNEQTTGPKKYKVTASAYNSEDTATIDWNIFNTELVISSEPVTEVEVGTSYQYKVDVFNYHKDELTFELPTTPAWLTIDQDGMISGTAPEEASSFSVIIRVNNQHTQSDFQTYTLNVVDQATSVGVSELPDRFSVSQNFPNPFNPNTTISYHVAEASRVILRIYNLMGQEIKTLVDTRQSAGDYKITWDGYDDSGNQAPSGVYFYKITSENRAATKKMILLR